MREISKKPGFFRRKYIINKDVQFKFLSHFFMVSFVSSIMVFTLGIFLFFRFNYIGDKLNMESGHIFYNFLNEQFLLFITGVFGIFLLSCLVMTAVVIFFSHRIAGPLFRLTKQLERISEMSNLDELNHIEELRFRDEDFYHDLASHYNHSISNLKRLSTKNQVDTEELPKKIVHM